jgi:hypothetical protein
MIHVPKTAGSVTTSLIKKSFNIPGDHPHETSTYYKSIISDEQWLKTFKFCFVRDPAERFVSTFSQLLAKPEKRSFDEYKKFNEHSFQRWFNDVYYPHIKGDTIKSKDLKLINWMKTNIKKEKPSGFNPDIYDFYLCTGNKKFDFELMLDFNKPKSEMKKFQRMYVNTTGNKLELNLEKIRDFNSPKYLDFWDSLTLKRFRDLNGKDIKFYNEFKEKM